MKFCIYLFLCLFVSSGGFGQKIKSITSNYYKIANRKEIKGKDSLLFVEKSIVTYSSKGNIKEEIRGNKYNPETSLTQYFYTKNRLFKEKLFTESVLYHEIFYKRDKKGALISKTTVRSSSRQRFVVAYINNQNGKCVKEIEYDHKGGILGTTEFIYNEDMQKVETLMTRAQSEFNKHYKFKYDTDGNLIEEISIDTNGNVNYIWKHEYDDLNRKVKSSEGYNGSFENYASFHYDEVGNIVKEVFSGTRAYAMEYQYQYDNHQNWLQKKVIRNGIVEHIVKRKITYF